MRAFIVSKKRGQTCLSSDFLKQWSKSPQRLWLCYPPPSGISYTNPPLSAKPKPDEGFFVLKICAQEGDAWPCVDTTHGNAWLPSCCRRNILRRYPLAVAAWASPLIRTQPLRPKPSGIPNSGLSVPARAARLFIFQGL